MFDQGADNEFVKFAIRVLRTSSEWVGCDENAFTFSVPLVFENTGWRRISISEIDYSRLFNQKIAEISVWLEARECAEAHYTAGTFRHLVTEIERGRLDRYKKYKQTWGKFKPSDFEDAGIQGFPIRPDPRDVPLTFGHVYYGILRFLLWAVAEIADKGLDPTKDIPEIEGIYLRHRQAWENPYQRRTFIAPLVGFKSDLDLVLVGRGYIIKRLADQDKNSLCNDWNAHELASSTMTVGSLAQCTHCIRLEKRVSRKEKMVPFGITVPSHEVVKRDVSCIITSLRLTKEGCVGIPCLFNVPQDKWTGRDIVLGASPDEIQATPRGEYYELAKADVKALRANFKAFSEEKSRGAFLHIQTALQRFNRTYSRSGWEDGVLDLVTCLESMLAFGENGSIGKRVGRRGSVLLIEEFPTDLTYTLLTQLYRVRNSIVHRGKSFADACKVAEVSSASEPFVFHSECRNFWNDCMEITRRILLQLGNYLYSGVSLDELIISLDEGTKGLSIGRASD